MKMKHKFVESIPEELEDKVLYVSMRYSTVIHKCACGCGNEVVTPLSPQDWELRYNGESISLYPSIGNWSLPCRSHYWIKKDEVRWSDWWSNETITKNRDKAARDRKKYLKQKKRGNIWNFFVKRN